ncbi:hypothetical protein GOODEAATRI_018272 [Goodea atripinnis]|uniref:Uncharacterized protein n=1 Tax=Goodea atripinnis TaxID=208336 RepID=A0ABV0NL87_9TELE
MQGNRKSRLWNFFPAPPWVWGRPRPPCFGQPAGISARAWARPSWAFGLRVAKFQSFRGVFPNATRGSKELLPNGRNVPKRPAGHLGTLVGQMARWPFGTPLHCEWPMVQACAHFPYVLRSRDQVRTRFPAPQIDILRNQTSSPSRKNSVVSRSHFAQEALECMDPNTIVAGKSEISN